MRIGQRLVLQTSIVFLASLATIVILSLNARREAIGDAEIDRLHDVGRTLHAMQSLAYEMRYLNFERGHRQWLSERARLNRELRAFKPVSDEGARIRLTLIEDSTERLPKLIDSLEASRSRQGSHAEDLVDIRLRRLLTTQAQMTNELNRLRAESSAHWQASALRDQRLVQMILILFVLVSVLSGWWLFSATVRPVLRLRQATRKLALGDLSTRASIASNDELGDLARDFNRMAEVLQRTLASRAELEQEARARKAMAAEREAALAELERSNDELTRFAYVASHDLQEPLRVVSGFLELIDETYRDRLDDKGHQWIGFAVDGAQRMHNLIDDLLRYARVTTRAAAFAEVDLGAIMNEVREDLAESIAETGAEIRVGALPRVRADASQMHQLMQNLIGNGIKFRVPGRAPRIGISAERLAPGDACAPGWRLSVADNGIGIDPAYHERIFQVFQRLHTREEYPGTGIGLAVCKKIVERHGGLIRVSSRPGSGARFSVDLPERPSEPRDRAGTASSENEADCQHD